MRSWIVLSILLLGSGTAFCQDDEVLEEATGLEPSLPMPPPPPPTTSLEEDLHWRGYSIVDWRMRQEPRERHEFGPNFEAGLTLDYSPLPYVDLFAEGRGIYDDESARGLGILDQGGIRLRPMDQMLIAVGKERNRRAPGLIISPSDFIHTAQAVPGLREERSGVWLGRIAWQTSEQSADLIALPVSKTGDTGFPTDESKYLGSAARYFARFPGLFDVGFDIGQFGDHFKTGAFVQSILLQVWKVYGETGYDDETKSSSHLLGVSYEGSSTYALRTEYYKREAAFPLPMPMLTENTYLILSGGAMNWLDVFNFTETLIHSVETSQYLNLVRAEWLANDFQTVGVTMAHLEPRRPFHWQLLADWKVSL
jgi:hypothetical protein